MAIEGKNFSLVRLSTCRSLLKHYFSRAVPTASLHNPESLTAIASFRCIRPGWARITIKYWELTKELQKMSSRKVSTRFASYLPPQDSTLGLPRAYKLTDACVLTRICSAVYRKLAMKFHPVRKLSSSDHLRNEQNYLKQISNFF